MSRRQGRGISIKLSQEYYAMHNDQRIASGETIEECIHNARVQGRESITIRYDLDRKNYSF